MRVGIADVFQTPGPASPTPLDVLAMVAMRNARLRMRRAKGKMSHSHWTRTYVSTLKAEPITSSVLSDDRSMLVIAVEKRSIWLLMLLGGVQGLTGMPRQ